ncbi:unnamed protein product [Thlaspi arvense]|uniref:PHD finger protein MALE STERILITY 1-like ubiquitin-like domain-containing protein n=1 Tax=Thlaspi arvense TaxID=13288 RepID=A0AAU9SUH0_THLAR|nr:unnamed protein product [Thlaspi arvense]
MKGLSSELTSSEIHDENNSLRPRGQIRIFCTILRKCHHHYNNEMKMPPQECIVVNKDATLSEVYGEAERVFREIYWELRDVVVESMADGQREITTGVDEMALNGNKELLLEGNVGMMMDIEVMKCYDDEYKKKDKRIECECGAKEEDGERMVCCVIFVKYGNTQEEPLLCVYISNSLIIMTTLMSSDIMILFYGSGSLKHPFPG